MNIPNRLLQKNVYLDTACMGLIDSEVAAEARKFIEIVENMPAPPTGVTVEFRNSFDRARTEVAKLLNVSSDEIALVESTSHGFGLLAACLPLQAEDNILICDLEFFGNVLCWQARRDLVPFEIRAVQTTNGRVHAADFEKCIDTRTRAILISAVQETNGFRADLQELSHLAKKHNCLLIVDGIQEAGAMEIDLQQTEVDAYCAGGHKWLCNPFGMGFLYINRKWLDSFKPPFYSYFNALEPQGGWQDYLEAPAQTPFDRLDLTNTAQKFETGGMGNNLGAQTLYLSIRKMREKGPHKVEEQVRKLGDFLAYGLAELGVNLSSITTTRHRSGITSFTLPGGLEAERRLCARLEEEKIFVSLRYTTGVGGIRVSTHHYNTEAEVERLLEVTSDFLRTSHR